MNSHFPSKTSPVEKGLTRQVACASDEQLRRFLLGDTIDADVREMEEHIADCAGCNVRLEHLQVADRLVQAMQEGSPILADAPSADCERVIEAAVALQMSAFSALGNKDPTRPNDDAGGNLDTPPCFDFVDPAEEPGELGRIGPYCVQRVIGRGGMGVVFEAFDPQLKRAVALKVILDNRLVDDRYRARFEAEALALARLQHRNIVQIHEVRQHRGRPYFVLEYLAGGNLAQFLASRPQPVRDSAVIARTLALAMQNAHEQGIVHRDLKPANILLSQRPTFSTVGDATSRGTMSLSDAADLKIADFGLARQWEQPGLTQTGELLGTPGYMAPELTQPVKGHSGPAIDIYALGAILYETLTGRPPFQADSVLSTLDQVRTLEPVPPRRLRPSVPRDLETICLKCLRKEANRRYKTAAAMAEDLSRFLEGRPILARPIGWVEGIHKAVRRRPAIALLVILASIMLVGATVGVLYHNVQLRTQVERADAEAALAVKEKERADRQYQEAYAALIKILDSFGEGTASIPQVVELQRTQSEHVLSFFERIVASQIDPNPRQQADLAAACRDAARLQIALGRTADAEKHLKRAIQLLEELGVQGHDNSAQQATLAACYDYLGVLLGGEPARGQEAVDSGRKAVALQERLVENAPSDARTKFNLAQACDNLGTIYRTHPGGSVLEWYERSLNILREIHRAQPDQVQYAISLAQTCSNIGPVYVAAQQLEMATAVYQEALAILEPLASDQPDNTYYAFSLAALRINLGGLDLAVGRGADGLQQYTLALVSLEAILRREPNYAMARAHLLPAHGGRAQALAQLGRHKEAVSAWDQVIALATPAQLPNFRILRAHVLVAEGMLEKAASEVDDVASAESSSPVFWYEAGNVQAQIATALSEEPSRAESHANQAIQWLKKAHASGFFDDPANEAYLKSPAFSALQSRPDFQNLLQESPSPR